MESLGPQLTKEERKRNYWKKYYSENYERLNKERREYNRNRSEEFKKLTKQWHRRNPERSLYIAARSRAKRQGVPFNLDEEDIVFPKVCPVLGIPIYVKEGRRTDNTPSVDRIIPSKGYIKGNIDIISWRANRLKNDASPEEIEKIYNYIKKRLDKPSEI